MKMSKENNGGPAFPREDYQANGYDIGFDRLGQEGMSLRDYFAAKAMASMCQVLGGHDPRSAASQAYEYADAMLAERNK
jgi:hypothetical protein